MAQYINWQSTKHGPKLFYKTYFSNEWSLIHVSTCIIEKSVRLKKNAKDRKHFGVSQKDEQMLYNREAF